MTRWRGTVVAAAGVLLGLVGLANAQNITLSACADVRNADYGVGNSSYEPVLCRSEFSVADPYIVLFGQVAHVTRDVRIAIDLFDPEGVSAFHRYTTLESDPDGPVRYTFAYVLPLAIDAAEARKKLPFARAIVLGRPASGRLGTWTWKFALEAGPSAETKFTLKP